MNNGQLILKDKIIILTGAGGGIGRVISRRLTEKGATIVLIDLDKAALEATYSEISQHSPKSKYFLCDLSIRSQVEAVSSDIISGFHHIDVIINNAGIQKPIGPFYDNDLDLWVHNIEVNLLGAVYLTRYLLPVMIAKRKGKIINLSGGGATSPRPNFSAYAVAKTAIVKFTEELAVELRELNIEVNAISPGAINTRMLDEVIAAGSLAGKELESSLMRKAKGGNDPELAAELICFLASDLSDGISGKLISAPWDDWQNAAFISELKNDSDLATIRRIDNKYFRKI